MLKSERRMFLLKHLSKHHEKKVTQKNVTKEHSTVTSQQITSSLASFKAGVSNSNQYEGHILTKRSLRAALERNMSLRVVKDVKKCLNSTKNCNYNYNLRNFDDDKGRTNHQAGRVFETTG